MSDLDAQVQADAARRFWRLRRRFSRFLFGLPVPWLITVIMFSIIKHFVPERWHILAIIPFFGFFAWLVVAMLSMSALRGFRCPRCGKRFTMSWTSSWPSPTCKHCGLYLPSMS